ncbi:MAG TPA: putative Ig domain-containing protein, partial [Nitrospirota bacterium]|nr:putative Ig domain-containing protein [Nitrospirota bacterium]
RVTPFDGVVCGDSVTLEREIRNMPPVITAHNEFSFDGTVYSYQVKASDPDDDTLAYSLEGAPDGMAINKSTGLITWKVPSGFKGDAGATAVVNDGNGGVARYSLKISIK